MGKGESCVPRQSRYSSTTLSSEAQSKSPCHTSPPPLEFETTIDGYYLALGRGSTPRSASPALFVFDLVL